MSDTIVVNLFGEPSAGKSTAASYIFSKLKMSGVSCEFVSEFAKDKVWEENFEAFKHQTFIFGSQERKLGCVDGKVDVIVTDSPLLLSTVYNDDPKMINNPELHQAFKNVAAGFFKCYNNYNILLTRQHAYENNGRNENEAEALEVRKKLIYAFEEFNVGYEVCPSNIANYDRIVEAAIEMSNDRKALTVVQELSEKTGLTFEDEGNAYKDAYNALHDKSEYEFKHIFDDDKFIEYSVIGVDHYDDMIRIDFTVHDDTGKMLDTYLSGSGLSPDFIGQDLYDILINTPKDKLINQNKTGKSTSKTDFEPKE